MTFARTLGALLLVTHSALAQEVHFSPEERLDAIDAGLIANAKSSIDIASYALTDPIVIGALNDADHRGVVVRIVLDPRERHDVHGRLRDRNLSLTSWRREHVDDREAPGGEPRRNATFNFPGGNTLPQSIRARASD
jgi:phosphatidylserine/phosphatidylglycerophosphate/cardiolipin synthase-like enzyme